MDNTFKEILELISNGNWQDASIQFRKMNISQQKFLNELGYLNLKELKDLCRLGYTTRDFTQKEK